MEYTTKELDFQRSISYYEIDSKVNSPSKFDEFGNPTDWFDLKDITTESILMKHKIDSSKMNESSMRALKNLFK